MRVEIKKSDRKNKKLKAIFFDKNGDKMKTVHFGAKGYSDFTKHKDPKRRKKYLARHRKGGQDWSDPMTAGALSRWILWEHPELETAIKNFKKRFGL